MTRSAFKTRPLVGSEFISPKSYQGPDLDHGTVQSLNEVSMSYLKSVDWWVLSATRIAGAGIGRVVAPDPPPPCSPSLPGGGHQTLCMSPRFTSPSPPPCSPSLPGGGHQTLCTSHRITFPSPDRERGQGRGGVRGEERSRMAAARVTWAPRSGGIKPQSIGLG